MKVLGHRVLIKPDAQPDEQSGIILPQDRDFVATSGDVLQVGAGGSEARYHARQRALAAACAKISADLDLRRGSAFDAGLRRAVELITGLMGSADPVADVKPGDRVAFDADHGLTIAIDGESHVIMNYDDIVVIVAEAGEAAA